MPRRRLSALLILALLLAACGGDEPTVTAGADGEPQGPAGQSPAAAMVAQPGADEALAAGTIEIGDDCIRLDERGHFSWVIAWPESILRSSDETGTLSLTAGDDVVTLHDLDRITLAGTRIDDADSVDWVAAPSQDCDGDGVFHVAALTEWLTPSGSDGVTDGPIGGGLASGTGADVALVCPEGIDQDRTEWFGPAQLTRAGAVAEAFGDLIVGWIGDPYEVESAEGWSSWGLDDDQGNLVALATVVGGATGWDPSHARFCIIPRPTPPPPPFTLYVSNQSFDDPTVGITITIDDEVVVDQDFEVGDQHNWIAFEPQVGPGTHLLQATSDTGATFSVELVLPEGEPRWAVVDYWTPGSGSAEPFTFHISDEPIGFA